MMPVTRLFGRPALLRAAGSLALFCAVSAYAVGPYKETFPKLGGMYIGTPPYENPTYQAQLAKYDLVILSFWKGWFRTGKNAQTVVQEIKARNPHLIVGNYTLLESQISDPNNTASADEFQKISSEVGPNPLAPNNDWWARDAAGNKVSHFNNTNTVNITNFVQPDVNGDRYPGYFVKRNLTALFDPTPAFDMWYADDFFFQPRENVDWNRDGVSDTRTSSAVRTYFRQALVSHVDLVNQLRPDLLVMGNTDGSGTEPQGYLDNPEYRQKIEGAFFESAIGKSFSEETWAGWDVMMNNYHRLFRTTKAPHLVMLNVKGTGATDYQIMRYGLTSVLMDDGYYSFTDSGYKNVFWFDEFDVQLGKAIDPPQTTPWKDGVYRRRFENGVAFVNPKGNGTRTVDIGTAPSYKHFVGAQVPALNNGQSVTSLTLNERDGVVLIRDNQTPIANAGPDQTLEAEQGGVADVVLDGRGSSDPDGDPLTYAWTWNGGSAEGDLAVATLPLGTTTVTLTVTDDRGAVATDTVAITVADRTAPTITSLTPSQTQIWPPNHKMVAISIAVAATDIVDPAPASHIVAVTSNEAPGGKGPDWEITGDLTLNLRAERDGGGDGRIYTITVQTSDASGNTTTGTTTVSVPHNQ